MTPSFPSLKVFNRMQGFWETAHCRVRKKNGQGIYEKFKDEFLKEAGKPWEIGRETADGLENDIFAKVYAKVNNTTEEQGNRVLDTERGLLSSPSTILPTFKDYIDSQEDGFRLNFYIDEIGQFIADNSWLGLTFSQSLKVLYHLKEKRGS